MNVYANGITPRLKKKSQQKKLSGMQALSTRSEKAGYTSSAPATLTVPDIEVLEDITIRGVAFTVPHPLENELSKHKELRLS